MDNATGCAGKQSEAELVQYDGNSTVFPWIRRENWENQPLSEEKAS